MAESADDAVPQESGTTTSTSKQEEFINQARRALTQTTESTGRLFVQAKDALTQTKPDGLLTKAKEALTSPNEMNVPDPDDLLAKTRESLLEGVLAEEDKKDSGMAKKACSVYGDVPSEMTGGRLLARFLSRYSFYNPHKGAEKKKGVPDLDAAWAHYEHVTLARVFNDTPKEKFIRAPPGEWERRTKLYPLWGTPTHKLGDFGVAVRMYFSTLVVLASSLAIAGFFNLPMTSYFYHDGYSDGTQELVAPVRASAVCGDTQWVQCRTCLYDEDFPRGRLSDYGMSYYDDDQAQAQNNQNLLALQNICNFDDWFLPGLVSYLASLVLVAQLCFAFFWLQRKAEIVFDEQIQTSSDYSIKINNPPPDATEPSEWRKFFSTFGTVNLCTVCVNNRKILTLLTKYRRLRMKLARKFNQVEKLRSWWAEEDSHDAELVERALNSVDKPGKEVPFFPSAHKIWQQMIELKREIENLMNQDYKAVAVFVTFENERGQRNALHVLSEGKLHVWKNRVDWRKFNLQHQMVVQEHKRSSQLPENFLDLFRKNFSKDEEMEELVIQLPTDQTLDKILRFRGQHVLNVKEAGEPNDVRWKDLEVPHKIRFLQFVGTTLAVLWFVAWSGFFINEVEKNNPGSFRTPLFIALTNILVPKICEIINSFESHSTEGARQASLYIKVAVFRWFNSGIALMVVLNFTDSISFTPTHQSQNLNQAVYNIIYAELFTIPIIKLTDIMGIVRKHILAPRAQDQEEMNSYFSGAKFELAERYTDATKVLFVSLFYSAILPSSLFLGAIALCTHYAVGKFCLLRMWRSSPDVGSSLARLSRNYFFSIAMLMHIIMSAYWWSGYPFDDLCRRNNYAGDDSVFFCQQDFLRAGIFPPLPRFQPEGEEWMTESQAKVVSLYGWTALVATLGVLGFFIYNNIVPFLSSFTSGNYEPDGKDQKIPFSSVQHLAEVAAYVPQFRENGFSQPLLACDLNDLSKLDPDVIGWKDDTGRGHEYHNLAEEARRLLGGRELLSDNKSSIFSRVQQWHPENDNK